MNDYYKLILVTNKQASSLSAYLHFVETCIQHGVTAVQLREKHLPYQQLITFGKALHALLENYHIPLIVNDNIELAILLGAEGVHLGQQDGDVIQARSRLGNHKIIGITVNSLAELHTANQLPIDYIGIGAIFSTNNKPDVAHHWGCDELQQAVSLTSHKTIAIGGINHDNIKQVLATSVDGIAAIAAFHDAENPTQLTQQLANSINNREYYYAK